MKVVIIVARFNQKVTEALLTGCHSRLQELGVAEEDITVNWVPGAVEIPLIAQVHARQKNVDAIIALGAVIRGETSHYDYVCEQVSQGCQQVMMAHEIPVIFGVLTTENAAQAFDRVGGAHGHKGCDAADAAVEMVNLMRELH